MVRTAVVISMHRVPTFFVGMFLGSGNCSSGGANANKAWQSNRPAICRCGLGWDAARDSLAAKFDAHRKASGGLVDMRDPFVAGIALARRATLATRNTKQFCDLMIPVVDPGRKSLGQNPGT
jgi:hypothetical protein